MDTAVPAIVAFVQNVCGIYLFHTTLNDGCELLVSCLIFLFSLFIILATVQIYPERFRKQSRCSQLLINYLLSTWIMEHLMKDFWFPLENTIMAFLPQISDFEEEIGHSNLLRFTRLEITGVIVSYMLSVFFLCVALNSVRFVDFRLLQCGVGVFVADINRRSQKSLRVFMRKFGIDMQKKVQFCSSERASRMSTGSSRTRSRSHVRSRRDEYYNDESDEIM